MTASLPCPRCGAERSGRNVALCLSCYKESRLDLSLAALLRRTRLSPSGCMEWTGHRVTGPWPYATIGRRRLFVHRLICALTYGPPPVDKPFALHSCDNPPCINPAHLRWGSNSDNVRDAIVRGRRMDKRRETCPVGHPYDEANTYITDIQQVCRACKREGAKRRYYADLESARARTRESKRRSRARKRASA